MLFRGGVGPSAGGGDAGGLDPRPVPGPDDMRADTPGSEGRVGTTCAGADGVAGLDRPCLLPLAVTALKTPDGAAKVPEGGRTLSSGGPSPYK